MSMETADTRLIYDKIKDVVYDSNPKQIQRISPQGLPAFHAVCTKQSGVHTQPWLCKQETNRVARAVCLTFSFLTDLISYHSNQHSDNVMSVFKTH